MSEHQWAPYGLTVYRSEVVERGTMLVLGGGRMPENWRSMTRDEQLRWAGQHGKAVVIHPLDALGPAPSEAGKPEEAECE